MVLPVCMGDEGVALKSSFKDGVKNEVLRSLCQLVDRKEKEKTTPFGVSLMRSSVIYRAAEGLKGIKVVSACPIVPPVASRSQCIFATVL